MTGIGCARRLSAFFAYAILALLVGLAPVRADESKNGWQITSIQGDVQVRSLDASWKLAEMHGTLLPGAEIKTPPASRLILTRGEDQIVVSPESTFSIGPGNGAAEKPSIIQQLGTMLFRIDSRAGKDRFRVRTPFLAAVIKGTVFSVSVTPEGSALHVTEGLVEVGSPVGGATTLVGVGHTARAASNGSLSIDKGDGQGAKGVGPKKKSENAPEPAEQAKDALAKAPGISSAPGKGKGLARIRFKAKVDVGNAGISKSTRGLLSAPGQQRKGGAPKRKGGVGVENASLGNASNAGGGNPNAGGGNPNAGGGNPNAGGGNPNASGGNPNAGGGNPNAGGGGGNPNAGGGGGNPNAGGGGGGNPNAGGGGGNPNAGGGGGNPNAGGGGGNPNAGGGGGNPNAGGGGNGNGNS